MFMLYPTCNKLCCTELKSVCDRGIQSGTNPSRKPLLNVCITRWIENIEGWERFALAHPFLIKMCEVIIYGVSEYEKYSDGWIPEDKRNALVHLKVLESFEFASLCNAHFCT